MSSKHTQLMVSRLLTVYSKKVLAQKLGITVTAVYNYQAGIRSPRGDVLDKLIDLSDSISDFCTCELCTGIPVVEAAYLEEVGEYEEDSKKHNEEKTEDKQDS